ncbi:MAG: alpha/beta hydrolase [Rhizobiales bacterium]|nr:alpha/beta hydrolase [Hyphomicrobiales bacterium]MBN9010119.1 alpha/beta hydrolase [Hyphomicrobiales bacterium]
MRVAGVPSVARIAVLALALVLPVVALAKAPVPYQLAPWKDDLFAYPRILDRAYDGDYLEVEYNRPRDLYARDVERGTKVNPKYVSLDTQEVEGTFSLDTPAGAMKYIGVGATGGGAKAITIFVHGFGASMKAGADDWIHGGNFNRLKNLMMRNGGVYLSAGFSDFKAKGTAQIKALVLDQAAKSPGAPVFLLCGSAGGGICWRLLYDPQISPLLGGIAFLDADMVEGYVKTARDIPPPRRVPIHISGSREDTVLGWRSQLAFFKKMKAAIPDYPIQFVLFSAGTHGLSLRMTDWRVTLNWMLSERRKLQTQ